MVFAKITRKYSWKFLERHRSDKKALEIGSGGSLYGYNNLFPNLTTVDVDPKRSPDVVADAHNLPFDDESFDIVLSVDVLEHLRDPRQAISEMKRVLKKEGRVILTTRFVYPIHDSPHDYWRFTKYGMQELFKDWEIIELLPETRAFSTIGVLFQRIAFQTRLKLNKLMKLKLFLLASLFDHLNFLLVEEYGDIDRTIKESDIMPSGYYIVCKKK